MFLLYPQISPAILRIRGFDFTVQAIVRPLKKCLGLFDQT
jgi:hypothetical protein